MRLRAFKAPTASRELVLGLAGLTLAACAGTPRNDLGAVAGPGVAGAPTSRYSGYKVGAPYQIKGVWYSPKEQPNYDEIGIASWYGEQFHNQYTADGEVFDMTVPSAAHKTLPLPSLVEVTNLKNGKSVVVRVNDRGPFVDGRIIDMSKAAAAELGMVAAGVTQVRVRYVGRAADPPGWKSPQNLQRPDERLYKASLPRTAAPANPAAALAKVPAQAIGRIPAPPPVPNYPAPAPTAVPAATAAVQTSLAGISEVDSLLSPSAAPPAPAPLSAPAAVAPQGLPAPGLDLDAGTFATEAQAAHVASGLTGEGLPEIQSVPQGAATAYRVVVHGLQSPAQLSAARSEALALAGAF